MVLDVHVCVLGPVQGLVVARGVVILGQGELLDEDFKMELCFPGPT